MRIFALLALSAALGMLPLAGCKTSPSSVSPAATYSCPSCKDVTEWEYVTNAGLRLPTPTGRKIVKHACPDCKKEWAAGMAVASTCAECAQVTMQCPTCMAMKK